MGDLGLCYENGHGVEKDLAQANVWYRKSAEAGHATAWHYLGVNAENGIGMMVDQALAVECFRKAAEFRVPQSMTALGVVHYFGREGVIKRDPNEALVQHPQSIFN